MFDHIRAWLKEKGITDNSNPMAQWSKMLEEVNELRSAITRDDINEITLEGGDVMVTLISTLQQCGVEAEDALAAAYAKIAKRDGKMIDGKFVKAEDLVK